MLDLASILAVLREVATRFPVEEWRIGDLHIWPLVRYEVANRNFELVHREPVGGTILETARVAAFGAAKCALTYARQRPKLPQRADVLLYEDGVSYVQLDGKYFDRFCDPVRLFCDELSLQAVTLTPHHLYRGPRPIAPIFVQPVLDAMRVFLAAKSRLYPESRAALDGFADACQYLSGCGAVHLPDAKSLSRAVVYVEAYSALYARVLRRFSPRVVLLPSYIGSERMAMALACHRLGVESVDIQHGAAGASHWAYGGFGRAPSGGYELLPSCFWCWSDEDAEAVHEWAGATHKTMIGGAPMVVAWRKGLLPGLRAWRSRVDSICASGRRQVLFALSGYETPELLEQYLDAAQELSQTVFCWFRTHPVRPGQRSELQDRVRSRHLETVDVGTASDVPLYALLERCDSVVLELSSVAYEAAMFGVPVVLMSQATGSVYSHLVAGGYAVVCPKNALAQVLLRTTRRGAGEWGPGLSEASAAISLLLQGHRE